MVLFEEKLAKEAWPEWRQQYIDYNMLKRKLDEVVEAKQASSEDLLSARRHIFQGMLDEQLSQASTVPQIPLQLLYRHVFTAVACAAGSRLLQEQGNCRLSRSP